MKITFYGAAGEVTGSQHLLECDGRRILFDCGLFQGHRAESRAKNERFHCDPKHLDAVILSHAHTDHCGNLPGLYKAGFRGPIFCTPATADVASVMLRDSAGIQEEDARYLRRKLGPHHPSVEPLYDEGHAERTVKLMETISYGEWHYLAPDVKLRFSDAGHILGSAITELEIQDKGEWKRVVFSGDLGRRGLPLLRDPQLVEGCDLLITESTYGDRIHPAAHDIEVHLERIIHQAAERRGRVIIPAFSLGRTQTLVYFLNRMFNEGRLPSIPVYVDSPLSLEITSVYKRHLNVLDAQLQRELQTDRDPFSFPGLRYIRSAAESASLNRLTDPFVVIASSGMCESGRVVHHLKHGAGDPNNTIVLIGFQAAHTLGRRIQERRPYLRIFDHEVPLKADVEALSGLSAHADAEDFKWWFDHFANNRGIGRAFIVHGEPTAATALAQLIDHVCDEPAIIPGFGDSFEV
ncbi:MBL fold metallo-hydrolase [bacterium]|nr:MBL fold metallo-hydrolase [bacterium]